MKREKTTLAVVKGARFNPATSEEDAETLKIIEALEAEGYKFKQIAQDAILARQGYKPEMFTKGNSFGLQGIQEMLERFASDMIREFRRSGRAQSADIDDDDSETSFTKGFAKSFMERQNRTKSKG